MPNVTMIPATRNLHTHALKAEKAKRRVAGYARVSTDSDEQYTSYEAQVDYYTKFIQSKPEWQFVKVYTDEGISAVMTKHREGFNSMIDDALAGKIDLIVTKSVSRFARNTVDSLTTVRKLKDKGVEVYFEKENIYTLDSKGELLITIMSSLAQEESRSISENVTWGQRKRFADGKVTIPYGQFLGYKKGADGLPEIVPDEAELVRRIYRMFMEGLTPTAIGKQLTAEGIPTPGGKTVWRPTTIESILSNETYKGYALLQKTFTVDFLQKKVKVNEGEIPQYYVEESHPAIVDPAEWDDVQAELERRRSLKGKYSSNSPFSAKIVCADCGAFFIPKVWHSTDKYKRTIWQCSDKYRNDTHCGTPHFYEDRLIALFLEAVGSLAEEREFLVDKAREFKAVLSNTADLDHRADEAVAEMDIIAEVLKTHIASQTADEAYLKKIDEYTERYDALKAEYDRIETERNSRRNKAAEIEKFTDALASLSEAPTEFATDLWSALVDGAVVDHDERITFRFKLGNEITLRI